MLGIWIMPLIALCDTYSPSMNDSKCINYFPLSIRISQYLQVQRAEISFSARYQGVDDILALMSITVSSFLIAKKWRHYSEMKRWRNYSAFIFSVLHMAYWPTFVSSYDTSSNNNNFYLLGDCCPFRPLDFDLPPSSVIWQITLLGGKSKSAGLTWQQCPQNEHYCYIILISFFLQKKNYYSFCI